MKTVIKSILNKLPLKLKLIIIQKKGIIHFKNYKFIINAINEAMKSYYRQEAKLPIIKEDIKIWEKAFKKFILAQPNEVNVAKTFFTSEIKLIKKSSAKLGSGFNPILICVVKDDLYRIQQLYHHYRNLGVKNFAILDNGSTDGTFEFLMRQNDTDLFRVEAKYTTMNREAWVNRLIAYYGFNRWYINVDSDELLIFNECENKSIIDLINFFENNNITRARALMVDMYNEGRLFNSNVIDDIYNEFCYFDLNTYYKEETTAYFDEVRGGPRERLFGHNPLLTKYPVFKFMPGDIQGKSHYQFPYIKNKNSNCYLALLHYKFLPNDLLKYKNIAEQGNYHNGSIEYKKYIEVYNSQKSTTFYYNNSIRLTDSNSIYKIPLLLKVDWSS
ncbi:hypothetical protein C2I17_14715 [Niallia circulans]|uniref:glycosyltransferase family 2 protein n=1 Tax=Niallia circulans TaxID=1397 RepID=UPI00201E4CD6|nr:glycosyltransferase family 2 protein [Niallia circulans]UQZ75702.1 hypothetical protein C2I17_14715 [Niallia circulans]